MQELQLYIGTQRVDLFKDESVSLTQTIQNIRSIDKVFTDFSKTFAVPASKTNNKIFKHYYNFDIDQGFDARLRVDATLEINNTPYKKGKIRLEGVDIKNQKPHTYRVTFFGAAVTLTDLFGENKLSDLDLDAYKKTYNPVEVENLLQADPATNDVICPLITHTQRLYYDTGSNILQSGNLVWNSNLKGVKWDQLKYALRVNKIIEQIESDYDLTFSSDFFKNTSIKAFDNLFMWLHRKSGKVEDLSALTTEFTTQMTGFPNTLGPVFSSFTQRFRSDATDAMKYEVFTMELNLETASSVDYTVQIDKLNFSGGNRQTIHSHTVTGGGNYSVNLVDPSNGGVGYPGEGLYEVFVTTSIAMVFTDVYWDVYYDDGSTIQTDTFSNGGQTTLTEFIFYPQKQIPDMKIIDFLNGLFRMFNLTAYKDGDIIKVLPLQDYYATYNTYDITDFVDTDSSQVNKSLPYSQVNIGYTTPKTFLAVRYNQLANKNWGEIDYQSGAEILDGDLFKVQAPFDHMQFERLIDPNTNSIKDIQWGWSVDEGQKSYKGAPLLFYPVLQSSNAISFGTGVNADDEMTSSKRLTGSLNMPSNSVYIDGNPDKDNINFQNEINEWTRDDSVDKTLFQAYYQDYIVDTFDAKRRLTKVTAYLPIKIFTKLALNDRLVIAEKTYKINQITTNLLTGKSDIELLNEV